MENKEFVEDDIDLVENVYSPESCRELCESHLECENWSYEKQRNQCYRKRNLGNSIINNNFISGPSSCNYYGKNLKKK